jgi:hypothetical protein
MFQADSHGSNRIGLCQLQEFPIFFFEKVPTAPYFFSPLQELFGDSFFVSLQDEDPDLSFGQPDSVNVLPAIRLAMPTPARIFLSRSKSTVHLALLKIYRIFPNQGKKPLKQKDTPVTRRSLYSKNCKNITITYHLWVFLGIKFYTLNFNSDTVFKLKMKHNYRRYVFTQNVRKW